MVKLLGCALLAGSLAVLSAPVSAQKKTSASSPSTPSARYEIGGDFAASYTNLSNVGGGINMGLPVDVRVGFLTHKKLMFEPRLSFLVSTIETTTYSITPGLNVLYHLKRGTGPSHVMRAPYVTGGVAMTFSDFGAGSATQFSIGGGVGKRVPFGGGATRLEAFLGYTFEGGDLPSSFSIGTRIGLSFWR
jgi:hypothetical protein